MLGVVALLDLAVIALLGIQFASKRELQLSLIVPTIVFNLFGAFIYNTARNQD